MAGAANPQKRNRLGWAPAKTKKARRSALIRLRAKLNGGRALAIAIFAVIVCVIAIVTDPLPGVAQGLVITGSDRGGTAYGIYELSRRISVSPGYWWADVTLAHRAARRWAGFPSRRPRRPLKHGWQPERPPRAAARAVVTEGRSHAPRFDSA